MSEKSSLENAVEQPSQPSESPQQQDHVPIDLKTSLSRREKWFIVILIALTSFFSPFTANIYFPAIPTISRAFQKPIELINLTVTVYVVFQGTSPMFWGTMSDNLGRRPIAVACLLLLSLSCIGIALVPTSAYWLLMLLRCLQAAGSASTLAIGAGVISDISTAAERGGFYGFYALGPMAGPALGPVVGGALTQGFGWRSIFWFLCIAVSVCLVMLITFFPETLPSRQNTRPGLKILYTPIIPIIGRKSKSLLSQYRHDPRSSSQNQTTTQTKKTPKLQNPFRLLTKWNILLPLLINATSFSVYFGIATSLSALFEKTYPFLDEFRIGLCFLATGGSMALGTTAIGKFLDWRYQFEKKQLQERLIREGELEKRLEVEKVKDVDKLSEFPLERARLKYLSESVIVLAGCAAGYGWCIHNRVNLAVPLILQAIIGLMCMAVMNGTTTLLIDLAPGQGSAVTACGNLVRCSLSAIIISIIQPIINGIGVGWTYILFSGFALTSLPWFYLELKFGPKWRSGTGVTGGEIRKSSNETSSSPQNSALMSSSSSVPVETQALDEKVDEV